jgi:hypothetical protein
MGSSENFRILKDNQVYMLDDNCETKEIIAYKKVLEDTNRNIIRFQVTNIILDNKDYSEVPSIKEWSNYGNTFYVQYIEPNSSDGDVIKDDIYEVK